MLGNESKNTKMQKLAAEWTTATKTPGDFIAREGVVWYGVEAQISQS